MADTTMNLPAILAAHRLWIRGDGGSRANLSRANLSGANLSRANLSGANLYGANLSRADLYGATGVIDAGQRSDGYRFVASIRNGALLINAGCRRDFTMEQARKHWSDTRGGTPLGDETTCILNHIEALAAIRKMIPIELAEAA